ncbi:MAG: GatB/YqeY domain-containing protein [Paraglaciecola sp.]|uniref:GatB/YqeY domain-containing protein n=1 Tax=Pseudomonadati TaxID=3379134 RepID=UPI00273D7BD0|nr:GatB/YqeY domain-containing protein [Paraglaciecola sp.]MDP5029764.1 GatB/YqeY domain-containing protein [Paraglaciecola sp.]MDP5041390.1 GatB/YqeY domain-containing protein [Paraglaciecola sp.]MDP5130527.1 GatB/YqeY domain-containing protein [Paraglaciecola sp.]
MSLLNTIKEAQKDAMRAKDKIRLGTIRMLLAGVKQREVDERIELNDTDVLALLTKMVKQRKDAAAQFEQANRQDLVDVELAEIEILQDFLPQALTEDELSSLVAQAIAETNPSNMQDMGKVMAWLKPKVQGRADMGQVSSKIKAALNA